VDIGSRACHAGLSGSGKNARQDADLREVEISVSRRCLDSCAEFERATDEATARARRDLAPRRHATGERDLSDPSVVDKRFAGSRMPVTTLITPSGIPTSDANMAISMADADVTSDGLITMVLPAARAGAAAMIAMKVGNSRG